MPVYRSPGVYIPEVEFTTKAIRGLPTNVFAFIGIAPRGDFEQVEPVKSYHQYLHQCSLPPLCTDNMSRAIEHFFYQGGNDARVVRVAQTGATHATVWIAGLDRRGTIVDNVLQIIASSSGSWANLLRIGVVRDAKDADLFSLSVVYEDNNGSKSLLESFDNLSLNSRSTRFVETILARQSQYIQAKLNKGRTPLKPTMKSFSVTRFKGYELGSDQRGEDGASPTVGQYRSALEALLKSSSDILGVCLPDARWGEGDGNAIIQALVAQCESSKRGILIADLSESTHIESNIDLVRLSLPQSPYLCCYYPWVILAATNSQTISMPPSSMAVAVWSNTDERQGVWKAPAGTSAQLFQVTGLADDIDDQLNGQLNVNGVNGIRHMNSFGVVLWGARTRAGATDIDKRYINVQRLCLFIRNSIQDSLTWVVFEPNNEPLWQAIRTVVSDFMHSLYVQGAFAGSSVKDSYFVSCGLGQTMTSQDAQNKVVKVIVGVAPVKPAEFVVETLQIPSG